MMRVAQATLVVAGLLAASAARAQPSTTPPPATPKGIPHASRGLLGLLAGVGAGAVLGLGGATLGFIAVDNHDSCHDVCDEELTAALIGGHIGINLGLAAGITLVGNTDGGKGSFSISLLSGLVASGVGWIILANPSIGDSAAAPFLYGGLPIVGTMTGYWLTHKHRDIAVMPTGNGIAVMGRF